MKLGICYMVFDGEELLEFAVRAVREQVAHISVTYQTTSYFGNPAGVELVPLLERLKASGLIDEMIFYDPDLSIHHKQHELRLRNIGLEASRKAGCTHHISADVDEFYTAADLARAKKIMDGEGYDFSMAPLEVYFKEPTYLVVPSQNLSVTFIHPVSNDYQSGDFPFKIEITRRLSNFASWRVFTKEEITIHHMSFVRKDIHKKFKNSDNGQFYKMNKFMKSYENYEVGGRVCLLPGWLNRKTILVENQFDIRF